MTLIKITNLKQNKSQKFLTFFLFFGLFIFAAACHSSNQTKTQSENNSNVSEEDLPDQSAPFTIPPPNINLASPLVVSVKPEDVALCEKINQTIEKSAYANARWGIMALSLKDGRVICSLDGRKLFNPASIQKTLTAIVALDKLGADFHWKTSVYAANQIQPDGTLNGDLVLYGQGAPDFDSTALDNLVSQLQEKGLKKVKGNVIGDDSYFRGDPIGDGWTWNELQWYYGAEASALSFNDNQAFINVENGVGNATTNYVQVTVGNNAQQGNANIEAGGVKRGLEDNNFYVWGNTKSFGARIAVHNPAGLVAKNFKEALQRKGIMVEGESQSRDWKSENKLDPAKAQELVFVESKSLGEVVKRMNKHSVNLYGELTLRIIGKKLGDTVPGDIQRPQNVRGDDTAGAAVIKKWLAEHHVATDEVQISDGSGLSRLDFVTPECFVKAFAYAAQSNFAQIFTDSLPIAATDGTLGGRLGKVKGKILAKTGTVTYVNALAGYADNINGEVLAFSIIANNDTRKNGAVPMIDTIATMLVNGPADDKETAKDAKTPTPNQNKNANTDEPNFVIKNSKK